MYDDYNLFKFSADLQELLYENERLKLENEELKKELKDIKVSIKDEKIDTKTIYNGSNNINVTIYSRTFSFDDNDLKKKLYSFKIEL